MTTLFRTKNQISLAAAMAVLVAVFPGNRPAEGQAFDAATTQPPQDLQRPSSVALLGSDIYVATGTSGSIYHIDATSRVATQVANVGPLRALASVPTKKLLLAADSGTHQLQVFQQTEDELTLLRAVPVAAYPVGLAVNASETTSCVSSLWSRRLTFIRLDQLSRSGHLDDSTANRNSVDLPFAPRSALFIDESTVIAADAFGGYLAVANTGGQLLAVHELPIHNIGDLEHDLDDRVLITYQRLDEAARTEAEHIHWGVLLQNEAATIPINELLTASDGSESLARHLGSIILGGPGQGAGDPRASAVTDSQRIITLAGTNEVLVIDRVGVRQNRLSVGQRPVDALVDPDHDRLIVVNELDDSVSIIDLPTGQTQTTIGLGALPTPTPALRGERAFFDASLSLEGWMSCHSCHTDGHTSHRLVDTAGDASFGSAKRTPSLLGTATTGPWAWNGSQPVLADQVRKSLRTTMHASSASVDDVVEQPGRYARHLTEATDDLVVYLQTLSPPPSLAAARSRQPSHDSPGQSQPLVMPDSHPGFRLFVRLGCSQCHSPPTFTSDGTHDVGLRDALGQTKFNAPSLRGVSQRDRLFHDGSVHHLEDVILRTRHQLEAPLAEADATLLLDFLQSL